MITPITPPLMAPPPTASNPHARISIAEITRSLRLNPGEVTKLIIFFMNKTLITVTGSSLHQGDETCVIVLRIPLALKLNPLSQVGINIGTKLWVH